MIRIHAQEISHIGGETIVEIQPRIVCMFLDQHRVAVAGLREPIDFVLFRGFGARLENQANARAFERCGPEIITSAGNGNVKRLPRRQDAIAGIEPKRSRFIWFD